MLAEIQIDHESMRGSSSDQGPLAKTLTSLANQRLSFVHFLEDGSAPIHNNSCENALRPVAVGRRNWLFAGSESGGHAAATIYSLIESCRRVGADPFLDLRDGLVRVGTHLAARVDDLMPEYWKERFGSKIAP